MFRPNRIGNPNIYADDTLTNTSNFTISSNALIDDDVPFNVINATPGLDFTRSAFTWSHAGVAITAAHKFAFGQQFTVTAPLQGNVRGVEVQAGLIIRCPSSVTAVPFLSRLHQGAAGAFLGGSVTNNDPVILGDAYVGEYGKDDLRNLALHYKTECVISGTATTLPGTYIHGFLFYQTAAAGFTLTSMRGSYAVRQLNDQENISYADTRR